MTIRIDNNWVNVSGMDTATFQRLLAFAQTYGVTVPGIPLGQTGSWQNGDLSLSFLHHPWFIANPLVRDRLIATLNGA